MENAGSKDLFVWYEMLLWGIREGNLEFVIDEQINKGFSKIVEDSCKYPRIMDRFMAFFVQQ